MCGLWVADQSVPSTFTDMCLYMPCVAAAGLTPHTALALTPVCWPASRVCVDLPFGSTQSWPSPTPEPSPQTIQPGGWEAAAAAAAAGSSLAVTGCSSCSIAYGKPGGVGGGCVLLGVQVEVLGGCLCHSSRPTPHKPPIRMQAYDCEVRLNAATRRRLVYNVCSTCREASDNARLMETIAFAESHLVVRSMHRGAR
jgi:hypothetical protein